MSRGFEDWTLKDVLNHNKKVQKTKNKSQGVALYTHGIEKLKKSKYRNEKVEVNRR